jgi:penicillin-binding protein 1C
MKAWIDFAKVRILKWRKIFLLIIPLGVWYYFCLPEKLFNDPYCTVLESQKGELLSAAIAGDGQWRFPPSSQIPEKLIKCLTTFEDKRFYSHPGFDLLSLGKSVQENLKAGRIVRGGSTISMQVIRLSRKGKPRTYLSKLYEVVLATRLELRYSKDEILKLYASHAPFGGNVVGLEAACWRYFGRSEKDLSWGEACLLAVLPNAPSLIHPGKNRSLLLRKRNKLLDKLSIEGDISEFTAALAKEEQLPEKPLVLPRLARHLLSRISKEGFAQKKVCSTISLPVQERVEEILRDYQVRFARNEIHNAAAIVAKVSTGEVVAYVGNIFSQQSEGAEVDIITSARSTGSILKPFLYAASLDEGKILPSTLLPDIPTFINGFTPKNFSHDFDGAVPANRALIRSLNIPAVFLLKDFRYEKFHSLLKKSGITTLDKSADHYGLSLILGGAEGTLWDISGVYASMARTLNNYYAHPGKNRYRRDDFHSLRYTPALQEKPSTTLEEYSIFSASSIYQTFEALKELYRPGEESGWRHFESSKKIAWKTGTSFGFRDAWAVGVTPEYVVGVWVGNADGEGRPGLTGIETAAPVLFDIFSQLDGYTWFTKPSAEMERITICHESGFRNSTLCNVVDTIWISRAGLNSPSCPYHKKIYLSANKKFQVNSQCAQVSNMQEVNWFVLPPVQEYYYKSKNIYYKTPPPFRPDCPSPGSLRNMDLVYPKPGSRLFIPRNVTGEAGSAVFQLAHRNNASTVFWYMDGNYLGSTQTTHHLALNPASGKHILTIIDDSGESIEEGFEILSNM